MAITVEWIEPKTNWNANSDRFNINDYNRIKNNLTYLHEYASELYVPFETEDMGEDATYPIDWDVDKFNAFERNIEEINRRIYTQDFGASQTFYPNGVFIQADELNRIERAMLSMKDILDRQKAGIRRLPFRLGKYKSIIATRIKLYFNGKLVQGQYSATNGNLISGNMFYVSSENNILCEPGDAIRIKYDVTARVILIIWINQSEEFISSQAVTSNSEANINVPDNCYGFKFSLSESTTEQITPETAKYISVTINGKYGEI